jgi:hypothetical protein
MPIAPGRLSNSKFSDVQIGFNDNPRIGGERKAAVYLQTKKTKTAGTNPACNNVRQNIILVLPGPGRP